MKKQELPKIPSWIAPILVALTLVLGGLLLLAAFNSYPRPVLAALTELFKGSVLLLVGLLGGYVFSSVLEKQKSESQKSNTLIENRIKASREILATHANAGEKYDSGRDMVVAHFNLARQQNVDPVKLQESSRAVITFIQATLSPIGREAFSNSHILSPGERRILKFVELHYFVLVMKVVKLASENRAKELKEDTFKRFKKYVDYVSYCIPHLFENGLGLDRPEAIFDFSIECPGIVDGIDIEKGTLLVERNYQLFEASEIAAKWHARDLEYEQLRKIFGDKK